MTDFRLERAVLALTLALALLAPSPARAQARTTPTPAQLQAVFPSATRFSEKRGRPPVYEAYGTGGDGGSEVLLGYAFLTSDLPPEMTGYSGPVEALAGVDLNGALTGVRVVEYHESLQETRGDFLARRGFQEQYTGKDIGDPFRVRSDIDGVSGATITVRALSLGVRNAARRVVAAYVSRSAAGPGAAKRYISTIESGDLERMSWADMLEAGLGSQVSAGEATISVIFVRDEQIGGVLMGPGAFETAVAKAGERVHEHHLMVLGIDGPRALGPLPRVFFAQGADTIRPTREDFIDAGGITLGQLEGAFRRPVLLLVDHALDVSAPFQLGLARCCGDPSVVAEYRLQEPIPSAPTVVAAAAVTAPGGVLAPAATVVAPAADVAEEGPASEAPPPPVPSEALPADADGAERLSPWVRVSGLFLLTGLAIAAVAAVASSARARAGREPTRAPD